MLGRIFTVGGYTLLSRLTGFARDIMLAAILGAGPMADAFFVAFRLPNHFRTIFAEGAYKEMPYVAFAEAVFALTYANKQVGIIPNFTPFMSRADDSSVVRAVLMQNQKAFANYATKQGFDWNKVTNNP